jgi:lipopolysaccharide/colanic/teichoic acid biosynthesis glycosyltransferase
VFAISLTILLSWLLVVIVVVYYLGGYRNIIFAQWRTGLNEKPFLLFKFRTLKENEILPINERRFGYGDFLRYTSLDELPQLWNILKGEMSFVGPRPLPVGYLELFSVEQRQRHRLKPGITGYAQVNGRHRISWTTKLSYDLYYTQHISPWLDIKIIFQTIILLLSFKKDVSLDENRFEGNE